MDYSALFDRILSAVDETAYLPLADAVQAEQRDAMESIELRLRGPFDVDELRAYTRDLHERGAIDAVMLHSALHVIAASPKVRDYDEAARCAADQEIAAIRLGGPNLSANLASVDRHRGVLAFMLHNYEVALDYFTRAFERQRTPGNLANVLATLLRTGDEQEAVDLLQQVRDTFPAPLIASLDSMIANDPDLALLR